MSDEEKATKGTAICFPLPHQVDDAEKAVLIKILDNYIQNYER